jgi:butyrate kinase
MFDILGSLTGQLESLAGPRPTVILAEPLDPRMIEAASRVVRFARFVFPAGEQAVRQAAAALAGEVDRDRIEFLLSRSRFVTPETEAELLGELAGALRQAAAGWGEALGEEEARTRVARPEMFAIMAVREGYADIVAGGVRLSPKEFFRPGLRLLAVEEHPYEVGIFVLPDSHPRKPFDENIAVFGDVGVNAWMTPEALSDIAVGTCRVARDLFPTDVLPLINGVIVSYSTKGTDEGPSVELVRRAARLIPERLARLERLNPLYGTIRIEAEVQVSCALSREAAELTTGGAVGEDSIYGNTNVIIAPNLDLGNFLYHIYSVRYPDARKFPQLGGVRRRMVEFARESTTGDVELGLLATILRLQRSGRFQGTPRDRFFRRYRILAINPGSTSTKLALSEGERTICAVEVRHDHEQLAAFASVADQADLRYQAILEALEAEGASLEGLDAVVGRGGLIAPVGSGAYRVNEQMLADLRAARRGEHASNLGAILAARIAEPRGIPAFIVDPVVVDEVDPVYKITGIRRIRRRVLSHALNQIATAKRHAEEHGAFYSRLNLIVAHLGGGITVGAHARGHYIEVNDGLGGEGPFSPERSGTIPANQLIDLCFSGELSPEEIRKLNVGRGGLVDLVGTADFRTVEEQVRQGDAWHTQVFQALAYQIAKEIAARIPAFGGERVDWILLTGGLARSQLLTERIRKVLAGLDIPVAVYPGENELAALREGTLRVLRGLEPARSYGE